MFSIVPATQRYRRSTISQGSVTYRTRWGGRRGI